MTTTSALILALLLAQSPDHGPESYLAEGLKALDANQPAAAEPFLRKAVDAEPTDVQAAFNLALVLGMQGKDAEAVTAYRKTLELKPALYEVDLNLGIVLLRDKQPGDALPLLKEASETKPGEFRPQVFYAQALFDTGDFGQAEQHFRIAAGINANAAAASLGIARSLLKQGKLTESASYFRAAALLDPAYKNALLELGSEYDKTGENEQAIAIYREFPANEAATKRLTQLLLETNNALAAIPNLEAEVKRAPTTNNRMALIDAYRQTSQKDKALEQLKLAVAADDSNFDLHMAYGRTLRDQRQFPAASREFQAAAALRPESVPALNELAGVLILADQYDDGLAALDRVRALGKEIPGDLYLRAITLDKLHRNKPALEAYRQFLAAADGKFPDEEFLSRQRARIIEHELGK
jgi:tetratricopeptide (TPR) repeat protein